MSQTVACKQPMRTLAIGDIHGCFKALQTVVAAAEISADDHLVTLGDYVDRGPEVPQVLAWLRDHYQSGRLTPLLGNHELMLQACRDDASLRAEWLEFGGRATLEAYSDDSKGLSLEDIPAEDWLFLEEHCVPFHETETHIFVHAGLHPDLPLRKQYPQILFWDRSSVHPPHYSGKTMVCGHTPQEGGYPVNHGHAIYIDTGVYQKGGWLTCLEVDTGEYWQGDQQGNLRHWQLDPDQ